MGLRWDRIALSIERNKRRETKMDTYSGKERRKENDINREFRERIHDKISIFVVVGLCLFLFKFHRLLR